MVPPASTMSIFCWQYRVSSSMTSFPLWQVIMDIKQYLYAWLGKQKLVPEYEFSSGGGPKHRQRFKCEVVIVLLDWLLGNGKEWIDNRPGLEPSGKPCGPLFQPYAWAIHQLPRPQSLKLILWLKEKSAHNYIGTVMMTIVAMMVFIILIMF